MKNARELMKFKYIFWPKYALITFSEDYFYRCSFKIETFT